MVYREDLPGLAKSADALTAQSAEQANEKLKAYLQQKGLVQQEALKKQGAIDRLGLAQKYVDANAKKGTKVSANIGADSASLSMGDTDPRADQRRDAMEQHQMEGLSKRYEKLNNTDSILQEIEHLSNSDGKGGVLTNPKAQLRSTGKFLSKVPTAGVGLAEFLNPDMKGATEERKALDRLVQQYQRDTAGMKQTDDLRKQEQAALGYVASPDPSLVAKGVRSLAKNMKNHYKAIQAGYTPSVRGKVHDTMGDPTDRYANLYEDTSLPDVSKPAATPPPTDTGAAPQTDPQMQRYMELKKKYGR